MLEHITPYWTQIAFTATFITSLVAVFISIRKARPEIIKLDAEASQIYAEAARTIAEDYRLLTDKYEKLYLEYCNLKKQLDDLGVEYNKMKAENLVLRGRIRNLEKELEEYRPKI